MKALQVDEAWPHLHHVTCWNGLQNAGSPPRFEVPSCTQARYAHGCRLLAETEDKVHQCLVVSHEVELKLNGDVQQRRGQRGECSDIKDNHATIPGLLGGIFVEVSLRENVPCHCRGTATLRSHVEPILEANRRHPEHIHVGMKHVCRIEGTLAEGIVVGEDIGHIHPCVGPNGTLPQRVRVLLRGFKVLLEAARCRKDWSAASLISFKLQAPLVLLFRKVNGGISVGVIE
mmetsp:Transcript_22826/g.53346  ORF Transcript_22826/g.53346 Transcript_22826/m.53346 type:complete len:231 (-) Transcript_22826:624-1316(-)